MHGPTIATLLVVASLGWNRPSLAGSSDLVQEARRRLTRNEGASAIPLLEKALPEAGPELDAVLELLRKAYLQAAARAESLGRTREAAAYREDLKILNRRPKAAGSLTESPTPGPSPTPVPLPDEPDRTPPATPDPTSSQGPVTERPSSGPESEPLMPEASPAATLPAPAASPAVELSEGDSAFRVKNYKEAGRIYGVLDREKRLPADRREHWAYCRSAAVVERINAHPQTEAEWATIDAEIDQIRAMNPSNWLGEYLRNRASERLASRKKPRPGKIVVRASSPEEPAAVDRPVRPASLPTPAETSAPAAPKPTKSASRSATAVGRWQVRETANFRIFHADPTLAEKVAQIAESARHQQSNQWAGVMARQTWQPQCELYLYPTAKTYAQMTGQPEDSPGFSTMGMNAGKIISRRINLRADHPTLLQAVLPHEITHVILADIFPTRQIPRWADEGLAVLSEPADEQRRRASDLIEPLAANRLFPLDALMSMDYPENQHWALYYAQSVSLTRFLVDQGTPTQMIQFLQGAQRNGYETELRRVYKIDGHADLQRRWLAYARALETAPAASTAAAAAGGPEQKVR